MRRRDFIVLTGGLAIAWPLVGSAQQSRGSARIGVLIPYPQTDPETQSRVATFLDLRALGWEDGRNLKIEFRWSESDQEKLKAYAQEFAEMRPELIFTVTTPVTAAVQRETSTVPTIFAVVSDPVGSGFVKSFARPEGNITGFVNIEGPLGGKWLELLKEIAPTVKRAAMIFNPGTAPYAQFYLRPFEEAAVKMGIQSIVAPVRSEDDIAQAVRNLEGGGGLVVMTDTFTLMHRAPIMSLAARHRVPAVYPSRYMAAEGALLSYGVDNLDLFRRAADNVDRILRGAKPSDLPVQVPSRFEMAINLKSARALDLAVPPCSSPLPMR